MSKLLEEIRCFQLQERVPRQLEVTDYQCSWDTLRISGAERRRYRFEARIGCSVDVDEDYTTMPNADIYTEVLKTSRQLIAEQVFGEFRQPLLKLRQRLASRADRDGMQLIDQLLDSMFKV